MKYDRWDVETDTEWPTEALLDLVPDKENKLSVWHIDDDRSNLNRIISALTVIRNNVAHFDYVLIDYKLLLSINIITEITPGNSPDEQANKLWHRNLCEMTPSKCLELAEVIRISCKRNRCPRKEVLGLVKESVKSQFFDLNRTNLKQSDRNLIQKMITLDIHSK